MPHQWVEPELFIEHRGVSVYRTYKDQDIEMPKIYWYTTDITEEREYEFDVRDLDSEKTLLIERAGDDYFPLVQQIIRDAIDAGKLPLCPDAQEALCQYQSTSSNPS